MLRTGCDKYIFSPPVELSSVKRQCQCIMLQNSVKSKRVKTFWSNFVPFFFLLPLIFFLHEMLKPSQEDAEPKKYCLDLQYSKDRYMSGKHAARY